VRTAIDTNVFSAIWSGEASVPQLLAKLKTAAANGALLVCPAVFAELHAYPGATGDFVLHFLATTGVAVDYRLEEAFWAETGRRFAHYADRRRQASGDSPRRVLADFFIGAHALTRADQLMTLDSRFYEKVFPEIRLF
jgi:predicted nucleic acid-binding protein